MKKTLTILAVLFCAVSLFALEMAAKVLLNPIVDKNGFRLDNAAFMLASSVSGDKAGATANITYNLAPRNKKSGLILNADMWFRPVDKTEYGFGFETQFSGFTPSDICNYARAKYSADNGREYSFKLGTVMTPDFDFTNSKYFYAAEAHFLNPKQGNPILHVNTSGLFKLNNSTPSTEMLFAELAYENWNKDRAQITKLAKTGLSTANNNHPFSGNEYGFAYYNGEIPQDTNQVTWTSDTTHFIVYPGSIGWQKGKVFKAAVSYQYSYLNNEEDNGLFASLWMKDIPLNGKEFEESNGKGSSLTVKAKLGFKKFTTELGYHFRNTEVDGPGLDIATNATVDFLYRGNKEFKCVVPHVISEIQNINDSGTLNAWVEYKHDIYNPNNNGVFTNVRVQGANIGHMNWEATIHAGFDTSGLKDDYFAAGQTSVSF